MKAASLTLPLVALSFLCIPPVDAAQRDAASPPNGRTQSAIAVWQEYQAALREGDEEKARACWTATARGYPVFNWHTKFDHAVYSARHDSLEIAEVRVCGKHIELHITSPHWQHSAWAGPPGQTYYVVHDPEALLAAPFEVLTDGWHERRTRYFVCHYPKDGRLTDDQANDLDEFYERTSSFLNLRLDRPIHYFCCPSDTLVGQLLGSGPAAGRAGIENWTVTALGWTSFHEAVHVMLGRTCTSALLEGAACYFGGATFITRDAQLAWAKTLVENGEAMPLATLLDESGFWSAEDMNDPYAEAAAFTGFLIGRHGAEAYKALYRCEGGADSLEPVLQRMSDKTVAQLEAEWKEWLLELDVPTIRLGSVEQATEIFRMDDPSYDDNGDGDFVYPLAPIHTPGMLDLTRFRVLSDESRVYFELTYRDLVEWPESAAWGFGGTYTRICIDCGRQGDPSFDKRKDSSGVWSTCAAVDGHCDLSIHVSDRGVQFWRDGRIVTTLLRAPPGERLGDAAADRIRFSIPCEESEAALKAWRYAIAVGGREGGDGTFRMGNGWFLEVAETGSEDTGGGGSPDGVGASFYDILLPSGQDQAGVLSARPVVLPMVAKP